MLMLLHELTHLILTKKSTSKNIHASIVQVKKFGGIK